MVELKEINPVAIIFPAQKKSKKHTVASTHTIIVFWSFALGIQRFWIFSNIARVIRRCTLLEAGDFCDWIVEFLAAPGEGKGVMKILLVQGVQEGFDLGVANAS